MLSVGAIAFVVFGILYAGRSSTARVVLAYFVPALLFALAAMTLHEPRRCAAA